MWITGRKQITPYLQAVHNDKDVRVKKLLKVAALLAVATIPLLLMGRKRDRPDPPHEREEDHLDWDLDERRRSRRSRGAGRAD